MNPESRTRRVLTTALELLVLAALSYVPLLLTKPGMVSADTKQYLYLDPGRFMSEVRSMWDPSFAGGTVTHQYIGYLLPQGPFFWLFSSLHVPVWVAQRLWLGSLLFLAGAGVRYAVKVLGLTGPGPLVAAVVYALSPYSMQYIERISAILMPWAALGWMLGLTVMAIRRGGWKYPALFGIVVALASGINATSLIFAGIAPVLWVVFTLFVTREAPARRVLWAAAKIGLLTLLVSVWWIAGLVVEARYGINVLKYTETVPAIAATSVASEVMRGLGYWYFYGSDRLGPWLSSSVVYTENIDLLVVSFILPVLGFIGAVVSRWRARSYFAILALIGVVLSVGAHPFNHPSFLGSGLKAFMTETTAGFALRSTDRATPLVVLALAAFLGAGLSALYEKIHGFAWLPAGLAVALAVVNAGPLITGQAVDTHFERPEQIPSYFTAAAKYLDSKGNATRVWIMPGDDFTDYTWGNTIDPVWPGILTRPSIQRQQLIDGSDATADLLAAFDLNLQQGTYEPSTLAPIARLLSAGDVVLESDYKFWHFNTPAPRPTWALFDPPPSGVGQPVEFGPAKPNVAPPKFSLLDEQALATSPAAPWPPPVAVFPVSDARPIYRAEPASSPIVLDGSGAGVVAAAAEGLLANNPTIFYAASLQSGSSLLEQAVPPGATLVLTDTNKKELRRWSTVRDNEGETLPAVSDPQTPDPTAQPLNVFPKATSSSQTIATYSDAHYVSASSYGNPVAFTPEDQPYMAFDGNLQTAWTVSAFSPAGGQWLQVALDHPVTTNYLRLVQPFFLQPNRWIAKVTLTFDGKHPIVERLNDDSHTAAGQLVTFPQQTFSTLRITIDATTWHSARKLQAASGVGFAEVGIPGINIRETLQMPSDLLSRLGSTSLSHRLVILMSRNYVGPYPPRSDPELYMSRSFSLPTARTFAIGGAATISALIPDNEIDDILGGPHVFNGNVLGSDERLPGDLNARAVFAFDGNPKTFWGPGFDAPAQIGAWMQANLTKSVTFDHLDLQLLADGEHSVPTEIRITTNTNETRLVHIPPIHDVLKQGHVASVRVDFPAVTGSVLRFTVEAVRQVTTTNWYTQLPIVLPFAIAEIGVPGLHFTPENPSSSIPPVCRDNLMSVDGKPVWLKVTGKVGAAEKGGDLQISGCGPDAKGIHLSAGTHKVLTTWGDISGLNVNRIALDSAPGGGPEALLPSGDLAPVAGTLSGGGVGALSAPDVRVLKATATSAELAVSGATAPFWLVLGQSVNAGWEATIKDGRSLGGSTLIDGFANGWHVTPDGSSFVVDLVFRPQAGVNAALATSAIALLACLILAVLPTRLLRRRRSKGAHVRGSSEQDTVESGVATPETTNGGRQSTSDPPRLVAPWSVGGRKARPVGAIASAVLAGCLCLLVIPHPWAAPAAAAAGLVVLVASFFAGASVVLALSAVGCAAAAGIMTVNGQITNRYPPGDSWPTNFEAASITALMAFLALSSLAIVEIARSRRAPPDTAEAATDSDEVVEPVVGPDSEPKASPDQSELVADVRPAD